MARGEGRRLGWLAVANLVTGRQHATGTCAHAELHGQPPTTLAETGTERCRTRMRCVGASTGCGAEDGSVIRKSATSAKVRPDAKSTASWPVIACQRRILTST